MYPKLLHASSTVTETVAAFDRGFVDAWHAAGFYVVPWGWIEGDPEAEATLAVNLCRKYGVDGWIVDAEDPYEGPSNYWKTPSYLNAFRRLAPHAPLGCSYIGDGFPHRDFPLWDWEDEGAAMLPQCYWSTSATGIGNSLAAAKRAGLAQSSLCYTLGTSSFEFPYSAWTYVDELNSVARVKASFNVWLLESTTDDYLRTLAQVRR